MTRVVTQYYPKLIDEKYATNLYEYLKTHIKWIDGIPSREGFTRKAKPLVFGENQYVDFIIAEVFKVLAITDVVIYGIYLNYYRDGNDYTPNHNHPGTKQLVISLGTTRTLTMNKNTYNMSNGDVIIFGSSVHGVPKDLNCKEGRISIALLLSK